MSACGLSDACSGDHTTSWWLVLHPSRAKGHPGASNTRLLQEGWLGTHALRSFWDGQEPTCPEQQVGPGSEAEIKVPSLCQPVLVLQPEMISYTHILFLKREKMKSQED